MKITLLFSVIALSACASNLADQKSGSPPAVPDGKASPSTAGTISGVVHSAGPPMQIHRAAHFDFQQSITLAEQAAARGDYQNAFGHFSAACAPQHPDSCFRAAKILQAGHIEGAPDGLKQAFFDLACDNGHNTACARSSESQE